MRTFLSIINTVARVVEQEETIYPPPTPNGRITTSVLLKLAIGYFVGGPPYNLM